MTFRITVLVIAMQTRAQAGAQGRRDEMHKSSEDDDAVLLVFVNELSINQSINQSIVSVWLA